MRAIRVVGAAGTDPTREAAAEKASIYQVYFQRGRKLIPAEWNEIGSVAAERDRVIVSGVAQPGFSVRGTLANPSGFTLHIPSDWGVLGGEVVRLDRGDGGGNDLVLPDPPLVGQRDDAVYLEAYFVEVSAIGVADATSHALPVNGHTGAGTDLATDPAYALKDPEVAGAETTRRFTVRWRLRCTTGIDVVLHPRGLGDPGCYGQGDAGSPVVAYPFVHPGDDGDLFAYEAGDGSPAAALAFVAVAGFTLGLPIAVLRRTAGDTTLPLITDVRRGVSRVPESVQAASQLTDIEYIFPRGTYTVGRGSGEVNLWRQALLGAGGYGGIGFWSIAGATLDTPLTSFFPLFPSGYTLAPGYKLRARVYGLCIRAPANGADSEVAGGPVTFGLRLRAPNQVYGGAVTSATWTLTRGVDVNGTIQRLEDILPPFDVATDGTHDGLWVIEFFCDTAGANIWNTAGIALKLTVTTA